MFKKPIQDTLEITYFNLPDFLTKTYTIYDAKKIVPNEAGKLLTLEEKKTAKSDTIIQWFANKWKYFKGSNYWK